jgi:small conductance mechanosensitive channel
MLLPIAQATTENSATAPPDSATLYKSALEKAMSFKFSDLDSSEWLTLAEQLGLRAALVIVLMILAWTLSSWASRAVKASLKRLRFDETLTLFLARLARWGILLMAALTCMSKFGVETTSFAALLGATGFAVGLAFQGTLSNFAAGTMLLVFRPYKVGDVVNIASNLGKVDEIELFTTTIDTFDNRRIIIPNGSIFGSVIENVTHHRKRRIDVDVGVSYSADIDATRKALEAAIDAVPAVLLEPVADVVLAGLGTSSVDWSVRAWGPTKDYLAIKQQLIRAIKISLDEAAIEIPFPQMDINVRNENTIQERRSAA